MSDTPAKPLARATWIARKACGCICAICDTNIPRKYLVEELGEWTLDGLKVELVDFADIKNEPTFLACPHTIEQLNLFTQNQSS